MPINRSSQARLLLAVLGLYCSFTAPSPAQPTAPSEEKGAFTPDQFDGSYKGISKRLTTNQDSCASPQEVAVDVRNGRIRLVWHGSQVFDARIAPDGSFSAASGSVELAEKHMTVLPTLEGRIDAAGLVADYGTRWCRYRLEASQSQLSQTRLSQRPDTAAAKH